LISNKHRGDFKASKWEGKRGDRLEEWRMALRENSLLSPVPRHGTQVVVKEKSLKHQCSGRNTGAGGRGRESMAVIWGFEVGPSLILAFHIRTCVCLGSQFT
jgi:hypothetical protein